MFRRAKSEERGRRRGIIFVIAGMLPAVALTSVFVDRMSSAAFSGTTVNSSNSLSSSQVVLTDNDSGAALFTITNMRPSSVSRCIRVSYSGDAAGISAVKMYAANTGTTTLTPYLSIAVDIAATGALADCSDLGTPSVVTASTPLASYLTAHSAFSNGASTWTPASGSESRTMRITLTLADDNNAQAKTTSGLSFTWEIQTV